MTRRAPRMTLAAVLALLVPALGSPAAPAGTLLEEGDAAALAQDLADAQAEQGICYGWNVYLSDSSGEARVGSGYEVGSSDGGPGTAVNHGRCGKFIILTGTVTWVSDSCECEDSVSIDVSSGGLVKAPTMEDLRDLGLDPDDLTGNDEDTALYNMVAALPLVASTTGVAAPVEDEPVPLSEVPEEDRPADSPLIPDFVREHVWRLVLFVFLIGLGAWMAFERLRDGAADAWEAFDGGDGDGGD